MMNSRASLPARILIALTLLAVAPNLPAQRPIGIDVSDYQSAGINWSTLKNTYGISFGWAKATEGVDLAMANFTTFESNAKAAGVYIGAYHFARYDLDTGTNGAYNEAEFFYGTAKSYLKDGGFYLMPMLDVEASFTGYTSTTLTQWVNEWCTTVTNEAYADGYLLKPCIYASSSHAADYFTSSITKWIPYMADWNGESAQTGLPAYVPWSDWTVWQYDDQNAAEAYTTGDGDTFNGTLAELKSTLLITAAGIQHWSGGGTDNAWTTAGNWDNNTIPARPNSVLFDNTGAESDFATNAPYASNNVVAANISIGTLIYSNWTYTLSSPSFSSQHTVINNGVTVSGNNGFIVGVSSMYNKGFASNLSTLVTISGAQGALALTGGDVNIGYQSSESSTLYLSSLLDMSGLGKFSYNVPNGTFGIAAAVHRRQGGEVYLANTNLITAPNISIGIGATGVATHAGLLHLGQSNSLNSSTIIFGKDSEGHVDFAPGWTNPVVRIRNTDGVSPVGTLYMGWTTSAGSSWGFGTNDFTAGVVDAVVSNLTISLHAGDVHGVTQVTENSLLIGPSASNSFIVQNTLTIGSDPGTTNLHTSYADGVLDMQGGTFTAGTVLLGSARNACTGTGTINIHGGTFTAQSITFATWITPQSIDGDSGLPTGNLNLDGGSVLISGNLSAGGGVSTCAVTNATLVVGGKIGTATNSFDSLTLNDATLQIAPEGGTNICAYVGMLDLESPSTIVLTNQNLVVGQFPLMVWQTLTGVGSVSALRLTVPAGITATLVNNVTNQSIDLLVLGTPANPVPVLANGQWSTTNTFTLTGNGGPNLRYHLYSTTNLALPLGQWDVVGATNADGSGQIQFVDQPSDSQRFYRFGR